MKHYFLAIDACTYTGTAAIVSHDGKVIGESETAMRGEQEERLLPTVVTLLRTHEVNRDAIAGIICGAGPGSFTSLRIAAAIAKGLAHGWGTPLFAAPSLLLTVASNAAALPPGLYLSMLDAMRGDWHALQVRVQADGSVAPHGELLLLSDADARRLADTTGARLTGPGLDLDARPHARGAALILTTILQAPVDLDTWEPIYGRLPEAEARRVKAMGQAAGT